MEAEFTQAGADLRLRAIAGDMSRDGKTQSLKWR
jgi:hypothetical protein